MESILGEEEVLSRHARVKVRTGHNFWSDCWIATKILHEFVDALFHIVDLESILGEDEVWSRQARETVRTGNNFWSAVGSWPKFYWSFRKPFLHLVDVESILGEEEVWSRHARLTVRTSHNFWSDRWIAIKILRVCGCPFPYSGCGIHTRWGRGLVAPG